MRRHKIVLSCIMLALVFACIMEWLNHRQDMPVQELIISAPTFPTDWSTTRGAVSGIDWRVDTEHDIVQSSSLGILFSDHIWTVSDRQDTNASIEQIVGNYHSSVLAWLSDTFFPLERMQREEWSNLQANTPINHLYPPNWTYTSQTANKEVVLCAEGMPENCYWWLYRARYGQYMVFLEFSSLPKGSNAETFEQIVVQIDKYISQKLKS